MAFNLPAKKVSRIVELGGNYYILKVEEKRGGVTKSFARSPREKSRKRCNQEESQRLQENWIAGLRQKAAIRTF